MTVPWLTKGYLKMDSDFFNAYSGLSDGGVIIQRRRISDLKAELVNLFHLAGNIMIEDIERSNPELFEKINSYSHIGIGEQMIRLHMTLDSTEKRNMDTLTVLHKKTEGVLEQLMAAKIMEEAEAIKPQEGETKSGPIITGN